MLKLPNFITRTRDRFKIGFPRKAEIAQNSEILTVARALDDKDFTRVSEVLTSITPGPRSEQETRLLLGFWRRLLLQEVQNATVEFEIVGSWLTSVERVLMGNSFWPVVRDADRVEDVIGTPKVASVLFTVLWDRLADIDQGLKNGLVAKAFLSGRPTLMEQVMLHFLNVDDEYLPDYWQFQSLARRWNEIGTKSIEEKSRDFVAKANREDFGQLIEIYILILRQKDMSTAFKMALELKNVGMRERLAGYLIGASQTRYNIEDAVNLHHKLATDNAQDERAFMSARLAVHNGEWDNALSLTDDLMDNADLGNTALCLRALANAHIGDFENANAALNHVRYSKRSPWYLKGRASLIGVSVSALEQKRPVTSVPESPSLHLRSGRPMAQSLWIGPKLRWIELLSIQSFLLNGWRYKLYVYDMPDNVPEGVEVCDANPVLPRTSIFREGGKSGAHSGSLGAFSDLFRYALLSKVGGFWTDTDVINLRSFDPDGCRMIASEWTDAGLLGPNGAQMAAPANDTLQKAALAAAEQHVSSDQIHFARIGPELLAELLGEKGHQDYHLLPPDFLNPVGWMETGRLLKPFEEMKSSKFLKTAHNIHVYTETWRLIGLDLHEPPQNDGFLPTIYERLMSAKGARENYVSELIAT